MFSEIDWTQLPGPKWYKPTSVPKAFHALLLADDEASAREACNDMLFAVGNNHAGSLYPAAAVAVHEVLRIAEERTGWVRSAALDILSLLVEFGAEPDFATFQRADGSVIDVELEIVLAVCHAAPFFLHVLGDGDMPVLDRIHALLVLDSGHVGPERISEVVSKVLLASPPSELERACTAYLDDLRQTRVAEASIIERMDREFPCADVRLLRVLVTQACWLSPNAAFAIVNKLARAPADSPLTPSTRLALLDLVASQFHHPLVTTVLPIARRMIAKEPVSAAESVSAMRAVAAFPGQHEALSIASFCTDADADEVDRASPFKVTYS